MAIALKDSTDRKLLQEVATLRHDLHAHPELMYEETRTAKTVSAWLQERGIEHRTGLAGGTGVLGYLPATKPTARTKTIALRADMDALPIQEATGVEYASQTPGKMHACGHDGHTANLCGAAAELARRDRPNHVLLVFQPAEEGGAGGKRMVEDGALHGKVLGPPADVIYGLHGFSFLDVGEVATCDGPMLAAAAQFTLKVSGKGGHAAMPHMTTDPVVAACQIVTAVQTIASRGIDPLESVVVSIPMFHAGSAANVIPEAVDLAGTVRTLSDSVRDTIVQRLEEICRSIAEAFNCRAELEWKGTPYPVTKNDVAATARFREVIGRTAGVKLMPDCIPVMGGEDFSFYGAAGVPACFFWLGQRRPGETTYPLVHTPLFNFNDDSIDIGIRAMTALATSE